ncbi:MAG TPA: hypothetical protein VK819_15810 [Acidobacteriaceae bacterium]|jgi:hypothetical protein|nr:hypothetical protein [Acidobacteriaceae bacterium]
MSLECWYYIAGIASAAVGLLGLVALIVYAYDTRQIRIAAQDQVEATMKPCAVVIPGSGNDSVDAPLFLKNVGVGVALNIRWRYTDKADQPWQEFPALGPGESRAVPFLIKHVINGGAVECEFESLSGARYSTLSGFSENTQNLDFRHSFKKL